MTDTSQPYRHLSPRVYSTPVPTLDLLSLEEMVSRIEMARQEAAEPVCPRCGSTADPLLVHRQQKWCPIGEHMVDVSMFARHRSRPDGRDWICKPCNAPRQRRLRIKRIAQRVLGRKSA